MRRGAQCSLGLVVTCCSVYYQLCCFQYAKPIFIAVISPENMENTDKIYHILKENHSSSFFKTLARATGVKKKVKVEKSQGKETIVIGLCRRGQGAVVDTHAASQAVSTTVRKKNISHSTLSQMEQVKRKNC